MPSFFVRTPLSQPVRTPLAVAVPIPVSIAVPTAVATVVARRPRGTILALLVGVCKPQPYNRVSLIYSVMPDKVVAQPISE
jgi:hypothetical protein